MSKALAHGKTWYGVCDLSLHGLSKRRALLSAPLSSFVQAMSGDPKGAGEPAGA